jgi:HK97 family phage major capsid protein
MSTLKDIREKRAAIHAQMVEALKAEQTPETRTKVDAMLADIETLGGDIARIERADKLAAEMREAANLPAAGAPAESKEAREKQAAAYRAAYLNFLKFGMPGNKWTAVHVNEEQNSLLTKTQREIERAQTREQRDQIAGTQSITYTQGTTGGYFVPASFVYDIEKATKYYAPLLDGDTVRILETATGQVLPYPTSNDTNQAWTVLGEAQQVLSNNGNPSYYDNYPTTGTAPSGQPGDVQLGHVNFGAWKGTTGIIRVSLELLQDSAFSLEAFLTEAFAVRLGRGYEYYLTQGTGSSQPFGIIPAIAASGAVAVTASGQFNYGAVSGNSGANSVGYNDLVALIHSIDPTYRKGAKFMFADSTLASLKKQLDAFGRPLWVPGVSADAPDTLAGYPYVINQSFPAIAASATTVAFGQWSKFIARKVRDLQIVRLDERFADYGEVAYLAFSRIDSQLVDAGTHPLNVLVQHS